MTKWRKVVSDPGIVKVVKISEGLVKDLGVGDEKWGETEDIQAVWQ